MIVQQLAYGNLRNDSSQNSMSGALLSKILKFDLLKIKFVENFK